MNKNGFEINPFFSTNFKVFKNDLNIDKDSVVLESVYHKICKRCSIKPSKIKNIFKSISKLWVVIRFNGLDIETHIKSVKVKYGNDINAIDLLKEMIENNSLNELKKVKIDYSDIFNMTVLLTVFDSEPHVNQLVFTKNDVKKIEETLHANDNWFSNGWYCDYDPIPFFDNLEKYSDLFNNLRTDTSEINKIKLLSDYFKIIEVDKLNFPALIFIISAIELLLTHKPTDNSEDSLKKQFVLKLSIVLHRADPSIDLHRTREKLRKIYDIRSDIAHGNFKSVQEKDYDKISNDIEEMQSFLKILVLEYIKDYKYINFLKDN